MAMELGFGGSDVTVIATAISEVARNIVSHSARGEVTLFETHRGKKRGICLIACDDGPRKSALARPAVRDPWPHHYPADIGYATDLVVDNWPMDDLKVRSHAGRGTVVRMRKWLEEDALFPISTSHPGPSTS